MTLLREPGDVSALMGEPVYRVKRDTTVSTTAIRTVSVRRSWPGAIQGLARGFLVGGITGAVFGFAAYEGPDLIIDSAVSSAGIGAAVLGLAGSGVGFIGGLIWGAEEVYEFIQDPDDDHVGGSR
jgi:hypothetical protein